MTPPTFIRPETVSGLGVLDWPFGMSLCRPLGSVPLLSTPGGTCDHPPGTEGFLSASPSREHGEKTTAFIMTISDLDLQTSQLLQLGPGLVTHRHALP